jgi:hypothetical protein
MTSTKKISYIFSMALMFFSLLAIPYFITNISIKRLFQFSFLFLMFATLFLAIWEKYKNGEKINLVYLFGIGIYGISLFLIIKYLENK